jgi:hypothetical protein
MALAERNHERRLSGGRIGGMDVFPVRLVCFGDPEILDDSLAGLLCLHLHKKGEADGN